MTSELINGNPKYWKWLMWIIIASGLLFSGWAIKDSEETLGKMLMSFGFMLGGFLLIYYAYKNLKD